MLEFKYRNRRFDILRSTSRGRHDHQSQISGEISQADQAGAGARLTAEIATRFAPLRGEAGAKVGKEKAKPWPVGQGC